ncbi:MAG: chromate transporter [Sphaerochaetaceae bacterium]|nr:chromate transporter [Sphaerochaetaceae bacterium]
MSLLLSLFLSFMQVGLFSIGGGYAAIPLIQNQTVAIHSWLTISEFTDLVTIAEMTPGPIAVNAATFVGIRIAGLPGAIVATFGCIFPSLIIVSLLSYIYYKYRSLSTLQSVLSALRPAVVGLIGSAALSMAILVGTDKIDGTFNFLGVLAFAVAFILINRFKKNPILIMVSCGLANLLLCLVTGFSI